MKPRQLLLVGLLFTQGCVFGIPDSGPAPIKPAVCEVVVYDNQGHGECISRAAMRKWMCKNLGACEL